MKKTVILLVIVVIALVAVSIVMVYSTSAIYAEEKFQDERFFLKKSLFWVGLSIGPFILCSFCNYRIFKYLSLFLMTVSMGLLLLTMFGPFGHTAGGATRWLRIGPIGFQPSELAKMAVIVYLADVLSRKQDTIKFFFKSLLFPSLLVCVILFLILQQPDLGTTALVALITLMMFLVAGIKLTYFFLSIAGGVMGLAVLILKFPYRMKRVIAFLDPFQDPQGSGFQIIQSFIALGSGGMYGVGLGEGKQKLFYLPEAHTDFIFAIIGEELGLLGTFCVTVLFFVFFICGVCIAYRCRDVFGKLLATGLVMAISVQAAINICVVTGMMPTKGIPLPFLSFGGTNLLVNFIATGVLINIALRGNDKVVDVKPVKKQRIKLIPGR